MVADIINQQEMRMQGVSEDDRAFLARVAAMERDGKLMREIAAAEELSPSGLTYRLACLGFVSRVKIIDQRTGLPLQTVLNETPAPAQPVAA